MRGWSDGERTETRRYKRSLILAWSNFETDDVVLASGSRMYNVYVSAKGSERRWEREMVHKAATACRCDAIAEAARARRKEMFRERKALAPVLDKVRIENAGNAQSETLYTLLGFPGRLLQKLQRRFEELFCPFHEASCGNCHECLS